MITDEAGVGFIGVVDGGLEEILVESCYVMVGVDLAVHIMAVNGE